MATLENLEKNFENPHYLFLTRHPEAAIESMMRVQIHPPRPKDTLAQAEQRWKETNTNVLGFLEAVPDGRWHRFSFEDLMSDTENTLRLITDFIGVHYYPEMADAYDGDRMQSGIGCVNLSKRERVERELGEVWKHTKLPQRLGPETSDLASRLGYQVPLV